MSEGGARFGAVLIHGVALLLGTFVKASSASIKDSSEARLEPQHQSEEVAQWWGEWSSWSTCSRTCGGGVQSQERHCLQQRLIAAQNVNSSICVGSGKRYQLCPNQPCPSNRISFKQQQCSSFNAKAFGRRHYVWVPLYPDDYTSISNKPCDLQCTTTTGERQLLVPAQDGTYCRDGIYQGVCIEGHCQMVGCDGKLYSTKTVDKCGVCGGNGGSCYRISGSYRKGIAQLGYLLITNIPVGATDIQIIERRKTENILALSDEAGHFFFNGNTIIDNPRNFRVAGTVFKYRRPANLISDGFEYIIAQGPTNQGLNVMYYNLNGKMPHITYEYTVPRSPEPRTAPPLAAAPEAVRKSVLLALPPQGMDHDLNDTSMELFYKDNEIDGGDGGRGPGNRTAPVVADKNSPAVDLDSTEHLVWELQTPLNLSNLPGVFIFRPINKVFRNRVNHKLDDHGQPTEFGADSNLIDGRGPANQNSSQHSRTLLQGVFLGLLSKQTGLRRACKNSSTLDELCIRQEIPGDRQNSSTSLDNSVSVEVYPGSLDSELRQGPEDDAPYGILTEMEHPSNSSTHQGTNLLHLHQVEPVQAPNTESNEFEVGTLDHDISLADMYRWKLVDYLQFIAVSNLQSAEAERSTCSEVEQYTAADRDNNKTNVLEAVSAVEKIQCLCQSKGLSVDEQCIALPPFQHFALPLLTGSLMTTVAGNTLTTGISPSYAMCIRYDGSEVDESYCDALTRPEPTHEFCTGKECPPRWETSRWSECSRTCGEGYQFRTVRCWKMMAPGFDSSVYDELCQANELQKPMSRKACKNKGCGPQWEISDWSECSARCGERGLQSREVRCSMETRLCNDSIRPLSEKECEGPPCDRRWTVSDWGPCSGPCGAGRMTRYVVCKNSDGNVISDGQCDLDLKPLAVYPCGDKNCPAHWVEQEWEQCNATCGRGVKVRQVVCAGLENGLFKEFPEQNCDTTRKPEESAPCFERPCSKWFTTSWSQCSKTCGSGVKVREVKCYQGAELGHSCDSALKPEARQTCEVQPCPTESPVDDQCQDKATANCALVLKVKLCTHWYYRKACCQSCKNKTQ